MTSSPEVVRGVSTDRPSISAGRAAVLATAMTVASYSATLVQYVVYARTLGVGRETDALAIVLAWATALAGLIATTLTGVALPPFVRDRVADPTRARSAFRSAVALAMGAAAVLAIATARGGEALATALSPAADVQRPVAGLLALTAILVLAWTVVGILIALANATEHYGQAAASGIAPSVVVAGALVLAGNPTPELALQAFVAGALLQIAWLAYVVRRDLNVVIPLPDRSQIADLARRCVPVVLMLLLFNGAMLIARALATAGDLGDVAVFDYGARLVLAGQQVLLAGVLAVALTKWSQMAGTENRRTRRSAGRSRSRLASRSPRRPPSASRAGTRRSLLTGGRFGTADATRVAGVLRWMAPGIAAQMVLLLGFRALTAYQRLWPMTGIGLARRHPDRIAAVASPLWGRRDRRGVFLRWIGARIDIGCPSAADRGRRRTWAPGTRDSGRHDGRRMRRVGGAAGCRRARRTAGPRGRGFVSADGQSATSPGRVRPGRDAPRLVRVRPA